MYIIYIYIHSNVKAPKSPQIPMVSSRPASAVHFTRLLLHDTRDAERKDCKKHGEPRGAKFSVGFMCFGNKLTD